MEPGNPVDQWPRGVTGSGIGAELRATLALAAPLAAANLAQMAMGVTNTVMVGRLGAAIGARERPSKRKGPDRYRRGPVLPRVDPVQRTHIPSGPTAAP